MPNVSCYGRRLLCNTSTGVRTMREIEIPARSNNATRKAENIKIWGDKGLRRDEISAVLWRCSLSIGWWQVTTLQLSGMHNHVQCSTLPLIVCLFLIYKALRQKKAQIYIAQPKNCTVDITHTTAKGYQRIWVAKSKFWFKIAICQW